MNFKKEFQRGPNLYLVEIDKLTLPKDADDVPRKNFGDIDQLAHSLAEHGQEYPITVRAEDEKIIVTDGARRTKAAELANERGYGKERITHLFAMLEEKGTDPIQRIGSKLTANMSKPFEPEELGETFKNLRDKHKKTIAEIADIAKVSTAKVRDCIALFEAPESLKKQVRTGRLRKSTAVKAIRNDKIEDVTLQSELGQHVKGKDIDEKKVINFDNLVVGFNGNGFMTREEATKQGKIGEINLEITIRQIDPKREVILVK